MLGVRGNSFVVVQLGGLEPTDLLFHSLRYVHITFDH
jgi:hypothetical protein